jgi:hypothetical protein
LTTLAVRDPILAIAMFFSKLQTREFLVFASVRLQ